MSKRKNPNVDLDIRRYIQAAAQDEAGLAIAKKMQADGLHTEYNTERLAYLVRQELKSMGRDLSKNIGGKAPRVEGIDDMIKDYVKANPMVKATVIAREMIEKEGLDYTYEHLAFKINKYKAETGLTETVDTGMGEEQGERYHVAGGSYHWDSRKLGKRSIPVDLADQIFYEFSRHGLDLSQVAIRNKHGISIPEWHSMKSALWLYKDSNIFSPYTMENTPNDGIEAMIKEKMQMKFTDKQRLVEKEYERQTLNAYKKVIEKDNVGTFAIENMIDHLHDLIPDTKVVRLTEFVNTDYARAHEGPDEILAVLADLHIGARTDRTQITPKYSPDVCKAKLALAAERINSIGADKVHLALLGDLIESFSGLNQRDTWKGIEYGMHGARVIREAVEQLEQFFEKITNLASVSMIGGNHDRASANWREDTRSEMAEIIAYFLQRQYGADLPLQYDPLCVTKKVGGINYIMVHGDKKVFRDPEQAVIERGCSDAFNLILSGHIHRREVRHDTSRFRWVVVPGVFSGNHYSESNGWTAAPGFAVFSDLGGMPSHTDFPL